MFEDYKLLKQLTSQMYLGAREILIRDELGNSHLDGLGNIIHQVNKFNKNLPTIIYMAHYDVVDEKVSNVIDNLASVVNLIEFSKRNKNYEGKNIFAIFTNYEELASFEKAGSRLIAKQIDEGIYGNVELVVNLELTSIGRHLWVNNYPKLALDDIDHIESTTPFNDAYVINRCGTTAICIGTLDFPNLLHVRKNNYCKLWSLCHKDSDLYSKEDMEYFVRKTMPKFLNT